VATSDLMALQEAVASADAPDWDIIVVGGGSAGMPAALFAARRGARVLLVEAAEAIGGSMWVSTGQLSAAGTRLQREKGIIDSPDDHYADVMRISRGTANPEIVRLAVDHAADTVDWLMDNGFTPEPHHPITGWGHEHYGIARYCWAPTGGLAIKDAIVPQVMEQVAAGAIDLRVQHRVEELVLDEDGAVTGVVALDARGERHVFRGRNVVLTSGGYAANPALFEELNHHPQYTAMPYAFSQGIGLRLGQQAGGYLRGEGNFFIGFGMILDSDAFPAPMSIRAETFPDRRQPWEIYVNRHGQRFVREDMPSVDAREQALLAQPDCRYWIVFDAAMLAAAPPLIVGWTREQVRQAFAAGRHNFFTADTLDALAKMTGIDADGLKMTVQGFNYGVETGHDFLGRQHLPMPIGEGPFHAIRMQGASISSSIGLAVDGRLRVIRPDGSAIPNLYAAGEVIGSAQTSGAAACGGMLATPALTFGRLLGASLVPVGATA